jgi:hypothetical protein
LENDLPNQNGKYVSVIDRFCQQNHRIHHQCKSAQAISTDLSFDSTDNSPATAMILGIKKRSF